MDYIEEHINEPIVLADVAAAAFFSPFHFHRIFTGLVGETPGEFIQRVRLERAATQLLTNPDMSVTRIAMANGYGNPAAFSRAFREAHGTSPTAWRQGGDREVSKTGKADSKADQEGDDAVAYVGDASQKPRTYRRRRIVPETMEMDVRVEEIPEMDVAYVRHIGPYKGDAALFEGLFNRLMSWAGPRGLMRPPETQILIVYHDDPGITDEAKLRTSVCITVPEDTEVSGEVGKMKVPSGRYARARFELADDQYEQAWTAVYGQWLPGSGYQPDDRPPFELYLNNPSEHPEGKAIVEICIPVRPL
jgi:AraC family transcriptional regulator